MIPIKVATASLNQTPLDWAGNQRRIEAVLDQARAKGVSLLVLPELCTTGYGCEDAFLGPDVAARAWSMLIALVPQTMGMVVSIGMPVRRRGGLYNTACVVADGRIAGFAAKEHLAGEGLHYEPRWFKPWPISYRPVSPQSSLVPLVRAIDHAATWRSARPSNATSRANVSPGISPIGVVTIRSIAPGHLREKRRSE